MYTLHYSLQSVKGVGPAAAKTLAQAGFVTVQDLLLHTPLRYEDRSHHTTVAELQVGQVVTLTGQIITPRNSYRGRRSFQSATFVDATGKIKLMWFNTPHVINRFKVGEQFLVSGTLNDRGTIIQPTVESFTQDSIHTGRLVPIYSAIPDMPAGTVRRILKEITDQLEIIPDQLDRLITYQTSLLPLAESICQLHFPENELKVVKARERLSVEELVQLILRSQSLKEEWRNSNHAPALPLPTQPLDQQLPFKLTGAQQRSLAEILADLAAEVPMNRLLLGDVGSGKTAVAGLACQHVISHGWNTCLVAPTQILAEQHAQTIQKLFPQLPVQLVTAQTNKQKFAPASDQPTFFIGTHALLTKLEQIKPGLLIYDEQHRFGVKQRSAAQTLSPHPHLLTLTATPIPRTLLLTIFSHLSLSLIDEMPPGRLFPKSWLVPEAKRQDGYTWIAQQVTESATPNQALVVCPFIDPSRTQAFENIAAATQLYQKLAQQFTQLSSTLPRPLRTELLHGRMTKNEQRLITQKLFAQEIDVLVTTPIVEVGLDLPAASIIVIEAAERFGLASLHQLRGRVGRAGQQSYCLLFTSSENDTVHQRLNKFCKTTNGLELAEQDLEQRGAGDIFGTQQHGLDQLKFANWTNLELITQSKRFADELMKAGTPWQSLLRSLFVAEESETVPLAN